MFAQGQHFDVEQKFGVMRCIPKTSDATSAYKTLQLVLSRLLKQIAGAPGIDLMIDGSIGPSTTLAVQVVAGRLAEGRYPSMQALATAQPEEAIPYVAQNAMELAGFFDQVASQDSAALVAPQQHQLQAPSSPDPIQALKDFVTVPKLAAIGAAIAGLTGIALIASAGDKRSSGASDRSHMMPESDGSDDMGDDDDDGGDDDETASTEAPSAPSPIDESPHAA